MATTEENIRRVRKDGELKVTTEAEARGIINTAKKQGYNFTITKKWGYIIISDSHDAMPERTAAAADAWNSNNAHAAQDESPLMNFKTGITMGVIIGADRVKTIYGDIYKVSPGDIEWLKKQASSGKLHAGDIKSVGQLVSIK